MPNIIYFSPYRPWISSWLLQIPKLTHSLGSRHLLNVVVFLNHRSIISRHSSYYLAWSTCHHTQFINETGIMLWSVVHNNSERPLCKTGLRSQPTSVVLLKNQRTPSSPPPLVQIFHHYSFIARFLQTLMRPHSSHQLQANKITVWSLKIHPHRWCISEPSEEPDSQHLFWKGQMIQRWERDWLIRHFNMR